MQIRRLSCGIRRFPRQLYLLHLAAPHNAIYTMKLHLPVILLTALMAVLSYVPVANGTVTVTSNGEPVQTKGTISETLSGEVNIEVKKTDDDEDLDALTIAENGIMGVDGGAVSITLSSEGAVTMQVGSEIGGTAAISITDGANFTAVDDDYYKWVYIGHSKQVGEATLQPKPGDDVPPQFSVTIDGPGSVMNLQGKSGVASPGHPGEGSGTPAGWIVLGYYEGTNWQKTEINITNGGALTMSGRAAIGSATGGLNNTCTSAITTINISGKESKLTMIAEILGVYELLKTIRKYPSRRTSPWRMEELLNVRMGILVT